MFDPNSIIIASAVLLAAQRARQEAGPSRLEPSAPVIVTILAISDFHGNLRPPL